jgi:hypothetical protein
MDSHEEATGQTHFGFSLVAIVTNIDFILQNQN